MDRARQRELVPHYAAVLLLCGAIVWGLRALLGSVAPWQALLAVVLVVLAYPMVASALGRAPDRWER